MQLFFSFSNFAAFRLFKLCCISSFQTLQLFSFLDFAFLLFKHCSFSFQTLRFFLNFPAFHLLKLYRIFVFLNFAVEPAHVSQPLSSPQLRLFSVLRFQLSDFLLCKLCIFFTLQLFLIFLKFAFLVSSQLTFLSLYPRLASASAFLRFAF